MENPDAPGETGGTTPREIQWKAALGAAVTFAVPVGVLCSPAVPVLSAGCCLWVLGGAVAAIGLYQRVRPPALFPGSSAYAWGALSA